MRWLLVKTINARFSLDWVFDNGHYELAESDCLHQTYIEEDRVIEMSHAVKELKNGTQFSFYDLKLSKSEEYTLSHVDMYTYNNVVMYSSEVDDLENHIGYKLGELVGLMGLNTEAVKLLSNLITRLTRNLLSVTGHENAEIIFMN